jgi:hypothetical protein
MPSRLTVIAAIALAVGFGAAILVPRLTAPPELPLIDPSAAALSAKYDADPVGLCPWREPQQDMRRFFPAATSHREETLIFSGNRIELEGCLQRPVTGEDHSMIVHRIFQGSKRIGDIATRRVKGEAGLIELVLAVDAKGKTLGARLQRHREPPVAAQFLQSAPFQDALLTRVNVSHWALHEVYPHAPASTHRSAAAVLDGVHTLLVLLNIGNRKAPARAS